MATGTIVKDTNTLVDEFPCYGWSNVYIARTNDVSMYIYIPQNVLKKSPTGVYSLSTLFNFTYFTVQPAGTNTVVTTYTLKGVDMMPSGVIQIEISIPSGVGGWTYGLVMITGSFRVRNYA